MNRLLVTKVLVTAASVSALTVACASKSSLSSAFDASDGGAERCPDPIQAVPVSPPPGTVVRAFSFHVTNDSGQARWVQTSADDGCSTFDLVRGGSPFAVVPPAACGCECKAPEPRTSYTRLAPGEAVDLSWNGLVYQLVAICVAGPVFGCADGEVRDVLMGTAYAAPAASYDLVLHVEATEPPGCTAQGSSPILVCGAEGAVAGRCVHGLGEARSALVLDADAGAAPSVIVVSLK